MSRATATRAVSQAADAFDGHRKAWARACKDGQAHFLAVANGATALGHLGSDHGVAALEAVLGTAAAEAAEARIYGTLTSDYRKLVGSLYEMRRAAAGMERVARSLAGEGNVRTPRAASPAATPAATVTCGSEPRTHGQSDGAPCLVTHDLASFAALLVECADMYAAQLAACESIVSECDPDAARASSSAVLTL